MLHGDLSPHDVFIGNEDEGRPLIEARMKKLQEEGWVTAKGGGFENAAVADIWNDPMFDKTPWIQKAASITSNIPENQKFFPAIAQKTFHDTVGCSLLGNVETKTFTAFHNLSTRVDAWISSFGYDSDTGEVTINPINQDSVKAWINEADQLLPHTHSFALKFVNAHNPLAVHIPELKALIPFTEDGIPLWP